MEPLNGTVEIYIPATYRAVLFHLRHYLKLAGQPGKRRMYDTVNTHYYSLHMKKDVYRTVKDCESCARNRQIRKQHKIRVFPTTEPLKFIAILVLVPLPKTRSGKQYIVVATDRVSNLTKVLPTAKTTTSSVATIFLKHLVRNSSTPKRDLTDNRSQFTYRSFAAICTQLDVEATKTTEYLPQPDWQVERFNPTLVYMLRHYVV